MATQLNLNAAKHAEISRRYAWQAKQRRTGEKLSKNRLITLIRLRELERLFQHRYGHVLPNDDAGLDDLTLVTHHVAHLGGDVIGNIVAWARVWAPWMPHAEAAALAELISADPRRFAADDLAARLRLSAMERDRLKITTIGAFDRSRAERIEDRKQKDRERKRARRAQNSSGRPRGRPPKIRPQQIRPIAADAFSDEIDTCAATPAIGAAKPPAVAVGTTSKESLFEGGDGKAVVDNSSKKWKTRFPTAMRLNRAQRAYALEVGFTQEQIGRIFEMMRDHALMSRSYSADWGEVWFNWVDREVDIYNERANRAYWERRRAERHG